MIIKNPSRIEYIDNEGVVSKVIYSTKHFILGKATLSSWSINCVRRLMVRTLTRSSKERL